MKPSARLFNCARCHAQCLICRRCDRGQRYCSGDCAAQARRESLRRASRRYQNSPRGRRANAARQRSHQQRKREKVTHQGSPATPAKALLPVRAEKTCASSSSGSHRSKPPGLYCHFCNAQCSALLRRDFLRSSSRRPHWRRSAPEP